ncbi:hypothetical protein [Roseovarius sp. Pro17]|uniref:alpha/beta hydrolase n=1 Tax=Roseovarius sp. Pro17 TaxID=3108175 RepID=UPI002D78DD45|nr:hypothetical protein [Roseovarius sp. Pro17]
MNISLLVFIAALTTAPLISYAEVKTPGYIGDQPTNETRGDRVFVFIHGLSSNGGQNAVTTWTSSDGKFWPQMLHDDPDFQGVDVFVADYETSAWAPNTFRSVSQGLESQLLEAGIENYSEIYFIAHSLGGVALRRAILDSDILRHKTSALFMFAVPNGGASLADLVYYVPRAGPLVALLKTTEGDSDSPLDQLKSEWIDSATEIPSFCGFEILPRRRQLVPRESVEPLCTDGISSLSRNHSTVVKPDWADNRREPADPHRLVKKWYNQVLQNNGFVHGVEKFDNREIAIASCPGDREYSAETIRNIRGIVRVNSAGLSVGVTRPMPTQWIHSDYTSQIWDINPPKWVVVHYSCFERSDPNSNIGRNENFILFAKDMLRNGVSILSYSRTFRISKQRRLNICDNFRTSSLLDNQTESAKIYMFEVEDGTIIGGGNAAVNREFGNAIYDVVSNNGEKFFSNQMCQEAFSD